MPTQTLKQLNPPIIAFGTFMNFVDRMRQGLPSLVDRSVVKSLAGGVQGQLLSALRYFDLIDRQGKPSELFAEVAKAGTAERQRLFRQMIEQHYSFCFNKSFDLERATRAQLENLLAERGTVGSNLQKAVLFFLGFAAEAGLPISNHISNSLRKGRPARPRIKQTGCDVRGNRWLERSRTEGVVVLSEKLPAFDLNWSDELKIRWLDSYDGLVELLKRDSPDASVALVESTSHVRGCVEVSKPGK